MLIIALIAVHMLSATLDIWKLILPTSPDWIEWDTSEIEIAKAIQARTPAQASILTAPIHDSPVALTGRAAYLGYAAHVWSHGGSPWNREDAIAKFYANQITQLPETQPDYVLIGPIERRQYPDLVIRPAWQLIAQTASYQLYRLPQN